VRIDSTSFVFYRLFLGFFTVLFVMKMRGQFKFAARQYHYLLGRTVFNCLSVYTFYKAVETTSVAEANILNMTYPVFITLFSWFLFKNQRDVKEAITVGVAFLGIWMILSPGSIQMNMNNLWGLGSGVVSAFAIIYLNLSRQHDDSEIILLYMFGLGALLIGLFFPEAMKITHWKAAFFLVMCSALGVLGQYCLTYGFYYVTAIEGSVISSTRILFAALLGPVLISDPALGVAGWIGAILIFGSNVYLAFKKAK
jgi:drug/metabolite transporter (DMT)-like permease